MPSEQATVNRKERARIFARVEAKAVRPVAVTVIARVGEG